MEMTECVQNARFFWKIISDYLSEVKKKLYIFFEIRILEKTSNFEVAPHSRTIAYQNIDNLLKTINIYPNVL